MCYQVLLLSYPPSLFLPFCLRFLQRQSYNCSETDAEHPHRYQDTEQSGSQQSESEESDEEVDESGGEEESPVAEEGKREATPSVPTKSQCMYSEQPRPPGLLGSSKSDNYHSCPVAPVTKKQKTAPGPSSGEEGEDDEEEYEEEKEEARKITSHRDKVGKEPSDNKVDGKGLKETAKANNDPATAGVENVE